MVDPTKDLPAKMDAIEQKLDAVAGSVRSLSDSVDARFDDVTAALVEQRQYTEFAFERLRGEMSAGFGRLERKLDLLIDRVLGRDSGA